MNTQPGTASKDLQGFSNLGGLALIIALALFSQSGFAQTFTLQNGADMQMKNGGVLNLGEASTLDEAGGFITDGSVRATRTLNGPSDENVSGLGAIITSSENLGETVITRTHNVESVNGNDGINRYFDITPTTNSGLNATLTFTYYDAELNSHPEDQLVLYRSGDGGTTYTHAGFDSRDDGANTLTLGGIDAFSRWTASAGAALELTLTMKEGWRMLANPVAGQSYEDMLDPLWTQGMPGADYESGDPNVYTWDETFPGTCEEGFTTCLGWTPVSNLDDPIPAGTGFLMYVFTDDEFGDNSTWSDKTLSLSGAPHTSGSGGISPTVNDDEEGWTLVGNPFSRPIDFNEVLSNTGTEDLTNAAYVYDLNLDLSPDDPGPVNGNGGAWRTTVGTYGDIVDGMIAPGQGFFVQTVETPAGTPSLTFSTNDIDSGGEFYGKENQLARQSGSEEGPAPSSLGEGGRRDFVRLEVQGESLYNSAWIRFSEEGSLDPTTGEALELQPLSQQYVILGARKADGTLMDIAHYPLDSQDLEIPLAVEATQPGGFTIRATDLDLPAGMDLYLHDRQTGESVPITDDSFAYSFTIENSPLKRGAQGGVSQAKGTTLTKDSPSAQVSRSTVAIGPSKATTTGTDRFLITTTPGEGGPGEELPDEIALDQNYPNPFNPTTQISYELPQASTVRLEVYDMVGRHVATLVNEQVAAGTHQVNFNAGNLSSGVYLYRLQIGDTVFTKKLTLIK